VRVVVAEDSVLLREGLTRLLVAQLLSRRSRPLDTLTVRERQVLSLMAEGRSNSAIATRLVVGLGAVEKHVASIFAKLGLATTDSDHRRVLAVLTYLGGRPSGVGNRTGR
jgi:DNA-binding NarL/FixJ family response regulator